MSFAPREWQVAASVAYYGYGGSKGRLVSAATGTGKTAFGHLIADGYLSRGQRVLWIAHRRELITQPLATLQRWWPQYRGGIVMAERDDARAQIVYASKDTIIRGDRLERMLRAGDFSLVVVDECHHSPSPSWTKLLRHIQAECPGVHLLGLTATPDREDTSALSDLWDPVYYHTILDGLLDGDLVQPFAAVVPIPSFDPSQVRMSGRDYDQEDLERALMEAHIVEHTVDAYFATHTAKSLPLKDSERIFRPRDLQAMCFTVTVRQALETANEFLRRGIPAAAVYGDMPKRERDAALEAFRQGKLQVLVSPAALTEGTDLPMAKCAILARPTRSWTLFVQSAGRVLRTYGNHTAGLLLDLAGATREHSLVSAPVLVTGTDCPESHNGEHSFLPLPSGEGKCQHCGKIIRCFRRLGGHDYTPEGFCKACGAPQCASSPDVHHHWVPWGEGKRACIHCATEIPDPLASLLDVNERPFAPVAWRPLNLRGRAGEVFGANLGKVGIIYNVVLGEQCRPYFYDGERLMPLSKGPTSKKMSRLLTDDIARRSRCRSAGVFGNRTNPVDMGVAVAEARDIARKLAIKDRDA